MVRILRHTYLDPQGEPLPRPADPTLRDRILHAAGRLFYEKGIQAVGMNEIIRAAGCGKNVVYGYFPSKDDLVAEYLTRFIALREQTAARAVGAAGDDPRHQILAIVDEAVQRLRAANARGCAVRNFLVEFPDGEDAAAKVAHAYLRRAKRDMLRRVTATGVSDPKAVSEQISLVLEGLYAVASRTELSRMAAAQARPMVEKLLVG
jgi:AcrR family transcriptional regulator